MGSARAGSSPAFPTNNKRADNKEGKLKIKTKELDNCEIQINVEVDQEKLEASKKLSARRMAKKINIPGFRKGKAPYSVISQHIGEGAITENAIEALGQEVYKEAIEQTEIQPFAPGTLVDCDLGKKTKFVFNIPIEPTVDLGNYKSVRIPYEEVNITDEAIDESIEHLRNEHALLEPIEQPAKLGDVIILDIKGVLNEDTSENNVLVEENDFDLLLDEKSEWPMEGFIDELIDISIDDTRSFELVFSKDYHNEELASKTVKWDVKCKSCKSRTLPELDDDFAKLVSEEYQTVLDLRVAVRKQLELSAITEKDKEHRNLVVEEMVKQCIIKFPPIMLENRIKELIQEQDRQLQSRGMTLEDYLKIQNQTEDELTEELKPNAIKQLQSSLMLSEIVKIENIEVEDDEIDKAIEKTSSSFGESAEQIKEMLQKGNGRRSIELDLISDKVLNKLQSIAKGEPNNTSEIATKDNKDHTEKIQEPSEQESSEEK